ncbi:testis-expressed protein 36 [Antechinus flavipes]|uniref:testis-expressed protein 36 n=1 Tax=Antechinus flavipes TaxID=38775 RepID=UPI002236542C|nr:testis-expressed protein 36 [Antechinus flavipes]
MEQPEPAPPAEASPTSRVAPASPAAPAPLMSPYSSFSYSGEVCRIVASQKERAGIWFPHLGLIEKTPESTTATMLKQPYLPESRRKVEDLLPFRYQFRQKQANKSNYPFSMHDNRHGLEFCGHGLDEGLGRKKHFDCNHLNYWASGYVPTPGDYLSTYQASYIAKPKAKGMFFRLFPKHHCNRWNAHFM